MFRVLERQENISPPGPTVVDSLELDLFSVWTLAVLEIGNPDLSASYAVTLHIPIRKLLLYELAEIPVLYTIGNPIDLVDRSPVQPYARAYGFEQEEVQERLLKIDVTSKAGLRDFALLLEVSPGYV